ncbi:MAG TPA: pilus assembly PilX N-terminal domain-containing protein [Blastocatellia bacterium]|nr:pilus assembly PilX N-terminal domain-containing protein [Blastocatellia bacterium]
MIRRKCKDSRKQKSERGFAMVVAMMALTLLTAMGLAVVFASSGDIVITGHFRRNEQAFFAAEAGIGLARESLRLALNQAILDSANAVKGTITLPAVGQPFDDSQITSILTASDLTSQNGAPITNALNAVQARSSGFGNNGSFSVTYTLAQSGSPVVGGHTWVGGVQQPPATVTMRYRYTITSTGANTADSNTPFRSQAQTTETGYINVTLNTSAQSTINRAFSSFGTFLNRWNGSSVWASGTFRGPVHVNTRHRFSSGNAVTFTDTVTQVDSQYDYNSSSYNVSNQNRTGLTFQSTFTRVDSYPLPQNVYAQELAVLNSTGLPDGTFTLSQPTALQLNSNLRSASNAAPGLNGAQINNGVYVPSSNGTSVSGGGIYVKGNADEITLSVSGSSQIYTIRQGTTTTTVTITPPAGSSAGSTTIASGGNSTTFSGVPWDRTSPDTSQQKPGVSLFVSGNISSLHGPAAVSGVTPAAVAAKTAVTITSTGDITVTGDLKYENPTVNMDGTSAANWQSAENVLGIFTNSGKIKWVPNATYTGSNKSITVDAAMVAFNEAALSSDSTLSTGGWETDCSECNSNTVVTLRGSRVVSKGLPISGSYKSVNRYFDPRFAGGAMAPPFFPVTQLNLNSPTISFWTSGVATESNTWQRITN